MLKVLIISNLFPLPWEPNRATFNRQQFNYLAKSCEIKILIVVSWLACLKNRAMLSASVHNNITLEYIWYFYLPKIGRIFYPFFLFLSLIFKYRQLKKFKPDCLLLSWAYPDAVAGTILAIFLNIPTVIKVHGSDINMHLLYPGRATQIKWAMRRAKKVICVSQDLAKKLIAFGIPEDKIEVIYNGVNHQVFYPQSQSEIRRELKVSEKSQIFLYIGNIIHSKGCADLLEAFKTLSINNDNVELYYIGSGYLREQIQTELERSHLSARVHFLGSLDHSELVKWIHCSNFVVLPSYNEGVPNVLLEAMACGKPVIATNVGGIPEVVPDYAGKLVDKGDVVALSEAMSQGLSESWNQDDITNAVKTMTWKKNSNSLEKILRISAQS